MDPESGYNKNYSSGPAPSAGARCARTGYAENVLQAFAADRPGGISERLQTGGLVFWERNWN